MYLIVGLLPLMIKLITAIIVFKNVQLGLASRKMRVCAYGEVLPVHGMHST